LTKTLNLKIWISIDYFTANEIRTLNSTYNPSKTITIKIKDTLQPNTTYSFFGQRLTMKETRSINLSMYFLLEIILTLKPSQGKSAYDKEVESFVSVLLYEVYLPILSIIRP
jgi:hypothetical protein